MLPVFLTGSSLAEGRRALVEGLASSPPGDCLAGLVVGRAGFGPTGSGRVHGGLPCLVCFSKLRPGNRLRGPGLVS